MINKKNIKDIVNSFKENFRFHHLVRDINNSNFKNIYIVSAAGYNNIGDDLMLLYTKKLFPNKKIKFLIDGINNNQKVINNIHNLDSKIAKKIPLKGKNKTLILIGGGTLFNTKTFQDELYLNYANNLIQKKYQIGFWGVEITKLINKAKAKQIFEKSIFIAVRNKESKDIISKINNKLLPKTIIIGDLIEHYPKKQLKQKQTKIVGICISPKSKIKKVTLLKLTQKYQKENYQVEFFSFCNHPFSKQETDSLYFTWLQNHNTQISTFNTNNLNCLFNRLKQYQLIITTRLHVTILANKFKIKVINVSKEIKNINFCKLHNIQNLNINSLIKS